MEQEMLLDTDLDISPIVGGPITNLQMVVPIDRNNLSMDSVKDAAPSDSNTLPMGGKRTPAVNFSEKIAQNNAV